MNKVVIGPCELYHGDNREILPTLNPVDVIITDPPYSAITHKGHNSATRADRNRVYQGKISRKVPERGVSQLAYEHLTEDDCISYAHLFAAICTGWIVWMTDSHLANVIRAALEVQGRYAFAPLPFVEINGRIRLSGDGPSSWTDWICVARTAQQARWGTLPGAYVLSQDKQARAIIGGKPLLLMDKLVTDYSRLHDTVLDPFMGAGTTGMACARFGRRFIGIEQDAERFDLACQRIETALKQHDLFAPRLADTEQPELELFA